MKLMWIIIGAIITHQMQNLYLRECNKTWSKWKAVIFSAAPKVIQTIAAYYSPINVQKTEQKLSQQKCWKIHLGAICNPTWIEFDQIGKSFIAFLGM